MSQSKPGIADGKPPGPASSVGIWIMALTLIVDQATKWIAEGLLDQETTITLLPILDIQYARNTGIAFSFLQGANPDTVLIGVIIVTIAVLTLWARSREGGRLAAMGFGLIVGGAIGNVIDRIMHGYVVDFLRLHIGDRTIFVFNLADFALTLGPILLVFAFLFGSRAPQEE